MVALLRCAKITLVALAAFAALIAVGAGDGHAFPLTSRESGASLIHPHEWRAYKRLFIAADGRVMDRENGSHTHSEAQGYGMLLAVVAGDRRTFHAIWRFTQRNLQIREADSLLAWRWLANAHPRVPDRNNATDGDIIVAYALLRAATRWNEPRYAAAADRIVRDIGRHLIARVDGRAVLRPARFGFDRMPQNAGPVVNLSYYFFPAFELFETLQPRFPWRELAASGLDLMERAAVGEHRLIPDWVALDRGRATIANGFEPRSSYDAVRIPLYLMMAGHAHGPVADFERAWQRLGDGTPVAFDFRRRQADHVMREPGYRIIAALAGCLRHGTPIPRGLRHFRPTTYFASSLNLMALATARQHYPRCLGPGSDAAASTILVGSERMKEKENPASAKIDPPVSSAPQAVTTARIVPLRRLNPSVSEPGSFSDRIMAKRWLPRP